MNRPTLPASRVPRLRRLSRPLEGTGPEGFLAAFQGAPRGFWGRDDRWVAWGGAIRDLRVDGPGGQGMARAVARLRESLAELHALRAPGDPAPRLFGGFAFSPRPRREGGGAPPPDAGDSVWEGFPAARFLLPEFLLEGTGTTVRLVLQWLEGDGSPGSEGEESGVHRLEELARRAEALSVAGGSPSRNGDPTPDHPAAATAGTGSDHGQERDAWTSAVGEVLFRIRKGELEKAVLARILDVTLPHRALAEEILGRLREGNPRAHVFLFEPDPGRILLGAAPEILAELRGGRFHATAVAGSISRGEDLRADGELAARLLASGKDLAEHRHTVEVMREALAPLMPELEVEDRPRVLTLARIQHLETGFRGRVAPGVDTLSLLEALHPTPAVCGRPRERALELIRGHEPFRRGWYAGPVGWLDTAGEGDFVPALRSAVGEGARWRLFAGAGIVEGSDPLLEWEETGLKFESVLRALGAERP